MNRTSRGVNIGLIGTAVAPAFHTPTSVSMYCGTFCISSATLSPPTIPRVRSPAAISSPMRSSSAQLIVRPK